MRDTRYKDANWNCNTCSQGSGKAETALLMDIRDELKRLNRLFQCINFLNIPREVRQIRLNTQKKNRVVTKRRRK